MNQAIVNILNENSASILAEFYTSHDPLKNSKDFRNFVIFVPSDKFVDMIAKFSNIPLSRLIKLTIFKDIISNHFAYIGNSEFTSVNGNTFEITKTKNSTYLDGNKNFYIKEIGNLGSVKLYIINGVLATEKQRNLLQTTYLETLPYDLFVHLVITGGVEGKDLINLCDASSKLNSFCEYKDQALFRRLLTNKKIQFKNETKSPKQVYKEKFIGGNVWVCGDNGNHELGIDSIYVYTPTKIKNLNGIVTVSGYDQSLFVRNDGKVLACGSNYWNETGLSHDVSTKIPQELAENLTISKVKIISVSTGLNFSLFLDSNGKVWSVGNNENGRCGLGEVGNVTEPVMIIIFDGQTKIPFINKIASGNEHSIMLDSDGNVWSFGLNNKGQLGLGHAGTRKIPTQLTYIHTKIVDIAVGYIHNLLLDIDGDVWSFGSNYNNQLGYESDDIHAVADKLYVFGKTHENLKFTKIAAGIMHSLLLDNNGNVWVIGSNLQGELGLGSISKVKIPTKIGFDVKFSDISAKGFISLFLDFDGNVYSCGINRYGELGLNDTDKRYIPTKITKFQTYDNENKLITVKTNPKIFSINACGKYIMLIGN